MMLSTTLKQNSNQSLQNITSEAKKAYLTLSVDIIFYLSLIIFQGMLPFNQTLVGLITLVQILICVFLTIGAGKLGETSSILAYMLALAIMNLTEFNRIVCEMANLEIMIEVSTLIFIALTYYRVGYRTRIKQMVSQPKIQSNSITRL